jgi:hypothetical protein
MHHSTSAPKSLSTLTTITEEVTSYTATETTHLASSPTTAAASTSTSIPEGRIGISRSAGIAIAVLIGLLVFGFLAMLIWRNRASRIRRNNGIEIASIYDPSDDKAELAALDRSHGPSELASTHNARPTHSELDAGAAVGGLRKPEPAPTRHEFHEMDGANLRAANVTAKEESPSSRGKAEELERFELRADVPGERNPWDPPVHELQGSARW